MSWRLTKQLMPWSMMERTFARILSFSAASISATWAHRRKECVTASDHKPSVMHPHQLSNRVSGLTHQLAPSMAIIASAIPAVPVPFNARPQNLFVYGSIEPTFAYLGIALDYPPPTTTRHHPPWPYCPRALGPRRS